MGSPEGEEDRKTDEGPQVEIEVEPFYMGAHEVTWAEYDQFLQNYTASAASTATSGRSSPPISSPTRSATPRPCTSWRPARSSTAWAGAVSTPR